MRHVQLFTSLTVDGDRRVRASAIQHADMGDDDDDRPRFLTGSPKLLELNWPCVQPTIGTNV